MLTAFAKLPDQDGVQLDSLEQVAEARSTGQAVIWIDLEEPTEQELKHVGQLFNLDSECMEDCLHGEQRPRVDEFDEFIFLVLYGAPVRDGTPELTFRKLAAFCGARFLVTVHREPLATVTAIRNRCARHAIQTLGKGVDFILYTIIDGMVDRYVQTAEACEERLDDLEERSLDPHVDESLLSDLSDLRRELIELRRVAVSQRDLLMPITNGEYDFISDSLEVRFSHAQDHLTQVVEVIDGLRELLNGIRDNYHSALAGRANAIMKTLTIFATIMLPLSLLAGIYGMNLPLWPDTSQPTSFWGVLVTMGCIAAGLLLYFRRRRWI